MNLTLLLTQNYRPVSVAAILDVFQTVNNFYVQEGKKSFFSISVVGTGDLHPPEGHKILPFNSNLESDLILVPAFANGNMIEFLSKNQIFVPWLQQHHMKGTLIASFCTGACLLAASGVLNGKKATTHIIAAMDFKKYFPQVLLDEDKIITEDKGVFTSGGATSSFHLMLFLIERFCGRDMAIKTSKFFAIDMDRKSQAHFSNFSPGRMHDDKIVNIAQERMEVSYHEINTVEEIIKDLPVSRRNFIRKFKGATGVTPIEYLQKTRIEAAKKILENTTHPITEVILEVGYSDIKAFRKLFRRYVGLTPSAYQEKFRGKKRTLMAMS